MARPIIALLTDFGTRDHYAGTMKGVVLGICPDATLVDISHDIPPHDVLAGALELAASYRYFPRRHDLPGGRRSGRRIGAPRHRGRSRRLSVRRARQRRADGGASRDSPAEAGRRAHRAALRAPDREPHVRGPRSVRAGGRLAGEGHRAVGARAAGDATISCSTCPRRAWMTDRDRRRGAARRSLRQPGHQHRSQERSRRCAQGGAIQIDAGRPAHRPPGRDLRRSRRRAKSCALFGSTDHLEIARQRRKRRRDGSASAAARRSSITRG